MTNPLTLPPLDPTVELMHLAGALAAVALRLRTMAGRDLGAELAMQRECSWCHTILTPGTLPATHGICPPCVRKLES